MPLTKTHGAASARGYGFSRDSYRLFGSPMAGKFIRDAQSGADSVDVVIIGDSNAGFGPTVFGGYYGGWKSALSSLGIPEYGTSLYPTGYRGINQAGGGIPVATTLSANGVGAFLSVTAMMAQGDSVTDSTVVQSLRDGVGVPVVGSNDPPTGHDTGDTNRLAFKSHLALAPIEPFAPYANKIINTFGYQYDAIFIKSAKTYTSYANWNFIDIDRTHQIAVAGSNIKYRVVYGTFASGAGKFTLGLRWQGLTLLSTVLASHPITNTNTGSVGYATAELSFTSNETNLASQPNYRFSYDGQGDISNGMTGPVTILWQSLSKAVRGFAVHSYIYFGGVQTVHLKDLSNGSGKLTESFFKEIRTRQIACGGTGRVIVWTNSGINGPDNDNAFAVNTQLMIDKIKVDWVAQGFPLSDLAFCTSVSHSVSTSVNAELTQARLLMPQERRRARVWGRSQSGGGVGTPTTQAAFYDIDQLYTGEQMLASGWYDAGGQSHLTQNGYAALTSGIVGDLIAQSAGL